MPAVQAPRAGRRGAGRGDGSPQGPPALRAESPFFPAGISPAARRPLRPGLSWLFSPSLAAQTTTTRKGLAQDHRDIVLAEPVIT